MYEAESSEDKGRSSEQDCSQQTAQATEGSGSALDYLWSFQEENTATDGMQESYSGQNLEANSVVTETGSEGGSLSSALQNYSRWLDSSSSDVD